MDSNGLDSTCQTEFVSAPIPGDRSCPRVLKCSMASLIVPASLLLLFAVLGVLFVWGASAACALLMTLFPPPGVSRHAHGPSVSSGAKVCHRGSGGN